MVPDFPSSSERQDAASKSATDRIPYWPLVPLQPGPATNALSGAHVFWYPALAVTAVWGVVLMPTGTAIGVVILLVYVLLLVLWGSVTLMVLEAVMQRRSVRELIGIAAFTAPMAVALVPALIDTA